MQEEVVDAFVIMVALAVAVAAVAVAVEGAGAVAGAVLGGSWVVIKWSCKSPNYSYPTYKTRYNYP